MTTTRLRRSVVTTGCSLMGVTVSTSTPCNRTMVLLSLCGLCFLCHSLAIELPGVLMTHASPPATLPHLIVFDLDGCLWKPELYELSRTTSSSSRSRLKASSASTRKQHKSDNNHFQHAPFTKLTGRDNRNLYQCRSSAGSVITLFPDVPEIIETILLLQQQGDIQMAISSRTDHPEWATELLSTFEIRTLTTTSNATTTTPTTTTINTAPATAASTAAVTLQDVMTGPIIIDSSRSKASHFEQLHHDTNVAYTDMMFFDNHARHCKSVSRLGVTVGYCPNGLSWDVFQKCLVKFPVRWGVVGLEVQ